MKDGKSQAFIGIDFGYSESTTVVLVRLNEPGHKRFEFKGIGAFTTFDAAIEEILDIMIRNSVPPENVSVPRFPAIERRIRNSYRRRFDP